MVFRGLRVPNDSGTAVYMVSSARIPQRNQQNEKGFSKIFILCVTIPFSQHFLPLSLAFLVVCQLLFIMSDAFSAIIICKEEHENGLKASQTFALWAISDFEE